MSFTRQRELYLGPIESKFSQLRTITQQSKSGNFRQVPWFDSIEK
jgi:hypothetical protein